MKTHLRWLYAQLPTLVDEGLIESRQAERIRERYGPIESADPLGRVLLVTASLAAMLIGSGLILIVAHNWDDISAVGRSAIGFTLLLAAQGLAGFALARRAGSEAWRESTALFVVLALAACMAIVAQAWQITWTPEGFLLSWVLLSLPLIYVMRARLLLPLAWLGIYCWGIAAADAWNDARAILGFLGMALLLVPAHVEIRRLEDAPTRSYAAEWAAALALPLALLAFWPGALDWMKLPTLGALLVLLYTADTWMDAAPSKLWQRAYHTLGGFGLLVLIFYGSFAESWKRPDAPTWPPTAGTWALALIAALVLLATVAVLLRGVLARQSGHATALWALPLVLAGADLLARRSDAGAAAILLNGVGALVAGLAIWSGLRHASLFRTNAGLALAGSLIAARFFDAEWSFAWRGSVFVALGVLTLALNLWIVRSSLRKEAS